MSLQEQHTAAADKFVVVMNHEEQYSIWPAERPLPLGWNEAGKAAGKAECLEYIKEVWTDMRPLSLRKQMAEAATHPSSSPTSSTSASESRSSLVERLSADPSGVKLLIPAGEAAEDLKRILDSGYVYIQFTETAGQTKLRVKLTASSCDLSRADFTRRVGSAHLEGELTLDFKKVRCIVDIDIQTLTGEGLLKVLPA